MSRVLLATLSFLLLLGCSGADPDQQLPSFPAEKSRADFPGKSYPAQEEALPRPGSLTGPVWLIGIDGATWDLIEPLAARGLLPHLSRLMEQGAHGVLLSEEPTISPALWATIATGMPRFEHGVGNFLVKLPGRYETVEAGPPDRRSPAVWELVGAAGGRSTVVGWFGSYPAEPIEGCYVSKGFDPQEPGPGQVHPPEAAAMLRERVGGKPARRDLDAIARSDFLRDTLLEDARMLEVFLELAREEPPDFAALYLAGTDVVQHVTWRHMDPASQEFPQDGEPDPRLSGVIEGYYRFIDDALGEIIRIAPEEVTLVLVSDHGAGPMRPAEAYHFQLEVLLESLGLMNEGRGPAYAIGELYRHDKSIWLNLEGVEAQGNVPPDRAGETARKIGDRLEALRTDGGNPVFEAVVDHVAGADWRPGDPALTVRFSPEALVAATIEDNGREIDFAPVRLRHADVSGAHRPEGILLLHGPGIAPGRLAKPATLYQIAPTLLYLLGLPQDGRMLALAPEGGGVLERALDPSLLRRAPVRMVAGYPGTDRGALLRRRGEGPVEETDPAQDEAMERLRTLGYVR